MPAPKNLWRPKNRPKFFAIFDFDREYLWNESTYQKSEKLLIIYSLYALEIDQGYLAHTPTGTGAPPKKILIVKIKNLA